MVLPTPGPPDGAGIGLTLCIGTEAVEAIPDGGPGTVFPAAMTVAGGRLRPAGPTDDPGTVVADPLSRLGDAGPLVVDREPLDPGDLAVALLDHLRTEVVRRWGRPRALTVAVPARWTDRQRRAVATAAAGAGWPTPTLLPGPVAAARRCAPPRSGALVGVIDVGSATETSVVRLSSSGGEVIGVPSADWSCGSERFDDALTERAVDHASPQVRRGLASGEAGWLAAAVVVRRAVADSRRLAASNGRGAGVTTDETVSTPAGPIALRLPAATVRQCLRREVAPVAAQFRTTLRRAGVDQDDLVAVILTGTSRHDPGVAEGIGQALGSLTVDGPVDHADSLGPRPAPQPPTVPPLADPPAPTPSRPLRGLVMESLSPPPQAAPDARLDPGLAPTRQTPQPVPVAAVAPRRPPRATRVEQPAPTPPLAPAPVRAATPAPAEEASGGWPTAAIAVILISVIVVLASVLVIVLAK